MTQRARPPRRSEDGEGHEAGTTVHLPVDEAFSMLRNGRRRAAIEYLARSGDGTASVTEIARAVAAAEHDVPAEHVTDRQRKCVYVSLLQVHLPALAERGVIERNESTGAVEGAESIGALAGLVDLVEQTCVPDAA